MPRTVSSSGRSHFLVLTSLGLLSFFFNSDALAQGGPAQTVAAGAVTTANVDEVSLDLVVHDKSGKFVPDLQPGELEITDGGSPVRIKDLRRVNAGPGADPAHAVTLLFDQMDPGNARSAQTAALTIVKATHESGIPFAVFFVDMRLHLMQAPTPDPEALRKAIDAATIAPNDVAAAQNAAAEKALTEDTRGGPRQAIAKRLLAMMLDSQKTAENPHIPPSVACLLALSRGQQDVPGRKTVVYFSQSLRWDAGDPESLRDIADAANRTHVSIYSVDAHAIDTDVAAALQATSMRSGARGMQDYNQASEQMGRLGQGKNGFSNTDPLEAICQNTGGLHAATGERGNMRKVAEDLMSYYVASFAPAAQTEDGRFRPIQVRALRSGLTIEARAGYFALPRPAAAVTPAFENVLLQALAAPKLAADLPFRTAGLRFGDTDHADSDAVVVEVPLSGVEIHSDAATKTYTAHVAILAELKDKTGAVVEKFSEDLPRQGTLDEQGKANGDVIDMRRHFSASPGNYVLETAAMDVNSGKVGAQRTELAIPELARGVSLSDIVVARRIDSFQNDADTDSASPLRCADGRVIPNLSGYVSRAAAPNVTLFFDIHPDAGSGESLELKAEVRRDGLLIGTVPLRISQNAGHGTIPYLAQLHTATLRAGAYSFTAILKQGAETSSRSVAFTLGE
jgi:VWFA-related protein